MNTSIKIVRTVKTKQRYTAANQLNSDCVTNHKAMQQSRRTARYNKQALYTLSITDNQT
mgnify:FL=1|tara:strand:+ start:873 stop:1049 length:177 start_codon:yes stop_codon:yes gene_type:complete